MSSHYQVFLGITVQSSLLHPVEFKSSVVVFLAPFYSFIFLQSHKYLSHWLVRCLTSPPCFAQLLIAQLIQLLQLAFVSLWTENC